MDDFRKRYDMPRANYGAPAQNQPGQPQAPARQIQINSEPSQPSSIPASSAGYQPPAPAQPAAPQAAAQTQFEQPQTPLQYQSPVQTQPYEPAYHRPAAPTPQEIKANTKAKKSIFDYKKPAIAAAAAVLLIGVGFLLFKPHKTAAVKPSDLAKKADFSVYYPSALPNGYTYNQQLATYDNGGAYYTFAKGYKHIIVREVVSSSDKLDTNEVTNPVPLETPVGKAVIGTNTGQTAAAVLAGKTYVFIYTNGSVPQDEVEAVVNKLAPLNKN